MSSHTNYYTHVQDKLTQAGYNVMSASGTTDIKETYISRGWIMKPNPDAEELEKCSNQFIQLLLHGDCKKSEPVYVLQKDGNIWIAYALLSQVNIDNQKQQMKWFSDTLDKMIGSNK